MSSGEIKVDRRQDEDGSPHFSYFDPVSMLSFVWSGRHEDNIQVENIEGQVVDSISPAAIMPNFMPTAVGWCEYFKSVCDEYIEVRRLVKTIDPDEDIQ
jgi:hypothetical protein